VRADESGEVGVDVSIEAGGASVITSKAAIRDRVKTGHTGSGRDQVI
jgi:hypothetical protein